MAEVEDRPDNGGGHFPGPSIWPFGFALGVAIALVALILSSWIAAVVGVVIALVFGALWIREATKELRDEPAPEPPTAIAAAEEDEEDEVEEHHYTRNVFLAGATLGIGAAIGAVATLPAIGFAVIPSFVGQGSEDVNLGPVSGYPENKWMVTTFNSKADEPADVVSRTAYIRNNGQMSDGQPSFTILSNRCVHLGCPVQPTGLTAEQNEVEVEGGSIKLASSEPSGFACPCHGGAYDLEGNRVAGPPVRALDRYEYSIIDGNLTLGQVFSVGSVEGTGADAEMIVYKHQDPGTHVDGPQQFFYPIIP